MMPKLKKPLMAGLLCALLVGGSTWFSLTFNGGRMVYPMDYAHYAFRWADLPMWLALAATFVYIGYLLVTLLKAVKKNQQVTFVRRLNPKLGLLGLLGFLGFGGFWTYAHDGSVFPFTFFIFFGFFGFFFEGRMSGTFMDERFRENAAKAQLKAFKIGFFLLFLLLCLQGGQRFLHLSLEHSAIFMLAAIAFIFALVIFLSEYLLYRYDFQPPPEEVE